MPVITISSSFGSGGSVVGKRVAEALGWELVNRAITVEVASQLSLDLEVAEAHDERVETGWHRLLENFAIYMSHIPESSPARDPIADEVRLRRATEALLREYSEKRAVIIGRAAAIVLSDSAKAVHVRLDGPREARLKQGAQALGLSFAEAQVKLTQTDRARAAYVREMYDRDWRDPSLYHLVIDSTSFSLDTCSALVLSAAQARFG